MKLGIKTAAVAGGVLTVLFAGCGALASPISHGSVQGCTAYGIRAIEHHITVTSKPAPCQGLSKAAINQAVALAVVRVTGDAPKALRRKRASEAGLYLDHLVSTLPPAASSLPTGTRSPAAAGRDFPMDVAALIAWLAAAGSGAFVLGSWMAHGGAIQPRHGATTGSPPALLVGHFGLALSGLVIWVAYLVTGWAALAWVAVGVLLPVAGLGMATLTIGLPGRRAATAAGHGGEAGLSARDTAGKVSVSEINVAGVGASRSTRTAMIRADGTGMGGVGTVSVRAGLSPLVVAAHGALAVTTMILVLLAALGGAAR